MRSWSVLLCLATALSAAAQQRPIFDPDDFLDPQLHARPVFVSRLVAGAALDFSDDYRPMRDDVAFLQIVNNLYWSHFQFGYKHSEMHAEMDTPPAFVCNCQPRIYFPTPRLSNQTPAAPPAGSRDTLHFGWYRSVPRAGGDPLMLRYRLTWSRQVIDRTIRSATTGETVERASGDEQSIAIEGDTHLRFRGRDLFGSIVYAITKRRGTIDDRTQHEFAYTHRFPGFAVNTILFRTTLTIGGVSNRDGALINVFNPLLEVFWHNRHTEANVHLVYSPQLLNDGANGWKTTHQVAFFIDRALFVKLFR